MQLGFGHDLQQFGQAFWGNSVDFEHEKSKVTGWTIVMPKTRSASAISPSRHKKTA
jgi:hypothetical protein